MSATKPSSTKFPNRILVGIEDDPRSDDALDAALALARRFRSALEVVHVFPEAALAVLAQPPLPPGTLDEHAETAIRLRLTPHVRQTLQALENDPAPPRLELVAGRPSEVLLERARLMDVDLAVLGPHRARRTVEFGSTTRALLAEGPTGVWTQIGPWRPVERILVPIDLSRESLHALEIARDFAAGIGAEVAVLHCFLVPELPPEPMTETPVPIARQSMQDLRTAARAEFEQAVERFEWRGVEHEALFEDGGAIEAVLEMQARFDLIALGTHGRTGLAAALLGNVADALMRTAIRPVLAVRRTVDDL